MKSLLKNISFKKWVWVVLLGIIILAAVLRFWQLGQVPIAPDWDEASLGYNAYSILHTGKDEYGAFLPVVLRSFGDYKPALYSYITIPSISVFGLNVFAVRLPSAVFGIVTVLFVFFLVKELFKRNDIALVSSFLLAISPWHIQFSRVAFETNIGLSLNILGVLLFVKALKRPWLLLLSGAVFALNLYAYQSEKVFTPLLVLALVLIYWKKLFALPKKTIISTVVVGLLVALPMVLFILSNRAALSRAMGVSVFAEHSQAFSNNTKQLLYDKQTHNIIGELLDNRRIYYAKEIVGNYLSHWSLNWLFITGDIARHHAPDMGLLYLWELPFLCIGLGVLLFGKFDKSAKWTVFAWFLIAPIPASVTTGVPHAVRTLNFLPTFQIFVGFGLIAAYLFLAKQKRFVFWGASIIIVAFALFNIAYFLDQYFVQTNYFYSKDWQYGYKQAAAFANESQNKYQKIVVSNAEHMDQSYVFFLFYLKYPPQLYQQEEQHILSTGDTIDHQFGKYEFRPIHWGSDSSLNNTLFIGNPDEFPSTLNVLEQIHYIDGTPAMSIVAK